VPAALYLQGNSWVLISVRGWVDPKATECGQRYWVTWKYSRTPPGIGPGTSRLVTQCFNQPLVRSQFKHRYKTNSTEQRPSWEVIQTTILKQRLLSTIHTRWFKYDRDKLWLVYTQIVPVIFEAPCIYDTLSLTNFTFFNAGTILWCTKNPVPNFDDIHSIFRRKKYNPLPSLSHLTSCTPTKSSLYLVNSPTTVISDPDLYRLLTFHVPNLISLFHCSGCTEGSVWFRGFLWYFVTWLIFYCEELLVSRPSPKLEDHPLSTVRDCLFNIFAATLRIYRPFLHPATWGRAMPWWQGITYHGSIQND
jgi:hypothetical protein